MRFIELKYNIGDFVYLKTDVEQTRMLVTGILLRHGDVKIYYLSVGINESTHYDFEISTDKNLIENL